MEARDSRRMRPKRLQPLCRKTAKAGRKNSDLDNHEHLGQRPTCCYNQRSVPTSEPLSGTQCPLQSVPGKRGSAASEQNLSADFRQVP